MRYEVGLRITGVDIIRKVVVKADSEKDAHIKAITGEYVTVLEEDTEGDDEGGTLVEWIEPEELPDDS